MRGEIKRINRYSEALKQKIVEEVIGGELTAKEASRYYGISSPRVVNQWVFKATGRQTKVVRVMMKSELERIRELEAILADEQLARRVMMAQLESYERYVPDLKKKLSTKELKQFEENQEKLKKLR